MTAYLWLVWYEASSRNAPRHWTLAVSYEANDRAYATVYEVRRTLRSITSNLTTNNPGDGGFHRALSVAGDTASALDE